MYLFDIFRSFLPLHNPIGFGAVDFIEIAVALAMVVFVLARVPLQPLTLKLAERPVWCMLFIAGLAIMLRLALLPVCPVPAARGADDFSYLLLSDTLAHFRLANPPHSLNQFFETNFVLQWPSYSSIYPVGPALALAFGQVLFHSPWAGVLLAAGVFCALCYWMLRGWLTPGWALAGGLLAMATFGPLSYWMNSYWGGSVSACAGCLVFGALPRLRERHSTRSAILLGLGLGLQTISRPYESVILDIAVLAFVLVSPKQFVRAIPIALLAALPFMLLLALHNRAVTGSFAKLPYMLCRERYGVPTTFTFQPVPVPHGDLTDAQRLYYDGQSAAHDSSGTFLDRLVARAPFARFFLLPPLFLAIPFFLLRLRDWRYAWAVGAILLFVLASNFYPYFYPHYVAAAACLVMLVAVAGLERLARMNATAARWLVILCGVHFVFCYAIHLIGRQQILDVWDTIPSGDPDHRLAIESKLAREPGRQLVFVRYWPGHGYHEWIHNAAEIDASRVVMADDLGFNENARLERYYPDRRVWLLEPDAIPPRLGPYHVPVAAPSAPSSPTTNRMTMEQVR